MPSLKARRPVIPDDRRGKVERKRKEEKVNLVYG